MTLKNTLKTTLKNTLKNNRGLVSPLSKAPA